MDANLNDNKTRMTRIKRIYRTIKWVAATCRAGRPCRNGLEWPFCLCVRQIDQNSGRQNWKS